MGTEGVNAGAADGPTMGPDVETPMDGEAERLWARYPIAPGSHSARIRARRGGAGPRERDP